MKSFAMVAALTALTRKPFHAELLGTGVHGFFERLSDCYINIGATSRKCASAPEVARIERIVQSIITQELPPVVRISQTARIRLEAPPIPV